MRVILIFALFYAQTALSAELFPFSVGANWTYQLEGGTSDTVTTTVAEAKTIDGLTWYRLVEYGDSFWVRNAEHGQVEAVNYYDANPDEAGSPGQVLIFKYPAIEGEVWNNVDSPTTYRGMKTITVLAGTFECHEYYIDMGNGSYSLSCIAIDVGVVYNEAVFERGQKEISRLVRYELRTKVSD